MFKLEILVEDKRLSEVLWELDGRIVGEPTIRPIRAAVTKTVSGKKTAVSTQPAPGASMIENIRVELAHWPHETISSGELRTVARKVGATDATQQTAAFQLRKRGYIDGPLNQKPEHIVGPNWQRQYKINRPALTGNANATIEESLNG